MLESEAGWKCKDNYFQCSTGQCIDATWECDNRPDCKNGEDEYPKNSRCLFVTSTSIMEQETTMQTTTTQPVPATSTSSTNQSLNSSSIGAPPKQKRDTKIAEQLVVNQQFHIPRAIKQKIESMNFDLNTELGRQQATEELYKNFKEFMISERAKKSRSSIHKHARKVRSIYDRDPNRPSTSLNWTDVLCNTSFNKWDVLSQNSNMSSSFYKIKDEEYLASMTYSYITAQMDEETVEKYGHRKNDFIASCKFNNRFCSPENFTFFHNHKYGNCYTFNHYSQNETKTTKRTGPIYGLVLELFIDQREYVANLAPEAGARVVLHKRGTMPFPEDEGINVMPGTSTSIGIKQVVYNRLEPPHGVCGDSLLTTDYYAKYKGTTPTKLSCLKSCFQDLILERCNCVVPYYYIQDNVTVCDMNATETETCVNKLSRVLPQRYQQCDNICPLPCKETRYEASTSQALWPSNAYEVRSKYRVPNFLLQRLLQTNALYMQIHDSKDEFIKLQIYFQDLIYQEIDQQKGYESMNLIGDLGGQLGLWLGLSAITIGEFCSFLCSICRSLPAVCRSSKTNPTRITPVTSLQPATLEEMYEDMCPELAKYDPPDITLPTQIKNITA
ncbi:Amiloride-sensitive sodium channel subunit beta [Bulinus truncatus]|nr:Amiloride-sensitive sodium channel subunit beta [Bulinus truncatus]